METYTLTRHIQNQHSQGVFEKNAEIIPLDSIYEEGEESDFEPRPRRRKKKQELEPPKKKAHQMTFTVAKSRQLMVVMSSANVVHLVGGDKIIIHRTGRAYTVAVTFIRSHFPEGCIGRQVDTTCRDVKGFYPV